MTTIINGTPVSPIEDAAFDLYERGFGPLFGRPGGKAPYDPRPLDAVHAAGLKSGVYATWTTPEQIHAAYQAGQAEGIALNVGVRCGMGQFAAIDVDTTAALQNLSDLAMEAGATPLPLTTHSPGKQDDQGNWVHRGGGHVWIRMPEDFNVADLPGTVSLTTGENAADQVDVKLHSTWVLCPPSVRAEGPYEWAGEPYAIYDAPEWLLERLEPHRKTRTAFTLFTSAERRSEDSDELDARIAEWAEDLDIPGILSEAGWRSAGVADRACGCEVWTRPGYKQSERSGILHSVGCKHNDRNAPSFHLWTTSDLSEIGVFADQRGITRLSPLHLVAAVRYDGDMGQAMRSEGLITRRGTGAFGMFLDEDEDDSDDPAAVPAEPAKVTFGNLMDFMPPMPAPTPARPVPAPTPVQPVPDETLSPTPAVPRIPVTPTATDDEFWDTAIFTGDAEEVWDAAGHFDDPRLATLGMWTAGMILTDPESHQWSVTAGQIMEACPMIDPREFTALVEHGGVADRPVEFFGWLLAVA